MGVFARVRPSVPAARRLPRWAGRAARLALLLVATSMAAFALVAASPIDPVKANLGQAAYAQMNEAQRAQLAEYWGATTPLPACYAHWAAAALRGDFGQSLRFGRPVAEVVGERFANSAALMASAWLLAGVIGLALGVLAGSRRGSRADRAICCVCYALSSMPSFWLGLVALMVFSVWLGWFPLGFSVPIGVDAAQVSWAQKLHHLVLPALVLGVANAPDIALHTRQKTIDVLGSEYARFARSRGEKGAQLLLRHGLRNLVLPAITIECASVSEVFGGSVLVEQVFSYPGLGQAAVTAGLGGDASLLVAIALVSACVVFAGNACADMLYALVDPRIREGRGSRDA
ncbi:ABC transporter permease [Paratractidigestivibacter sp.]|uniref:ABC transporter permease n=1 Tax=Paratractidigestivibacter sp. TaxID=2847316 RepID=UPI003AB8488A